MAELTGPELLTRTQAFFKEVLPMAAESLINGETVLASNLERVSKGIVIGPPAKARVPLRIGRNPAVGARSFKGALPKPGNSRWASTLVTLGYNYGTLYIPGQYFKAKTADAAFGNYLTEESEALVESLKLDYNRQLLGDATGILATCGVMGAPGDVIPVSDTKWFYIDQIVDIRTTATGAVLAAEYTVVAVDTVTSEITLVDENGAAASTTTAATHSVYVAGARNVEIKGLKSINSDVNPPLGPLQEIDVADVDIWKANVLATGGAAPTETLLEDFMDSIDARTRTGRNKKLLLTTYKIRQKFAQSIRDDRQIPGDTMVLKGGFKAVWWNDNPIVAERDQDAGRLDAVDLKFTKEWTMSGWETMDQGGSRLIPDPNGTDGYIVRFYKYSQAATTHRATGGTRTGISEA